MSREEIMEGLGQVIEESSAEEIDWSTVTEDIKFEAFGLDSLSVLDLIFDLEQEFEVQVPAEDMLEMETVGDLVTYLEQRISK